MFNIGLSTHRRDINEDLFIKYNEAEISNMEVSVSFDVLKEINPDQILKYSKKYNVNLWSFHLPFYPFEIIDISQKNLQQNSICILKDIINKWSEIGINKFVIHPGGEPISDNDREERLITSRDSLNILADYAYLKESVIAVENLPRTCLGKNSSEMKILTCENEKLKICFDTNHLLSEDHKSFIKNVGCKIITTHISDYDFIDEKHWMPGLGKINWSHLIKELIDSEYNGLWMYEADGPLDLNDYKINFKSCFSNCNMR